jgi:hypothetical protein
MAKPLPSAEYTNSLNKFSDNDEVDCGPCEYDTVVMIGKRRTGKAFMMRTILEQQRQLLARSIRAKL